MSPFSRGNHPSSLTGRGPTLMPHLMFDGCAEEAMRYYVGLFADASIESMERYGDDDAARAGKVKEARALIGGQTVLFFDSPSAKEFSFTPAMSLYVECTDEDEINLLYENLLVGGRAMMPIDDYGPGKRFGWVCDKFGVSWRLNLAA